MIHQEINSYQSIPLDEALTLVGGQKFGICLSYFVGYILFTGLDIILMPSYVIPSAECDLNLSLGQKGILGSASFIGMIFSSHLVGYLADTYGRRSVLLVSCSASTILLLLSSISPSFEVLIVLWMINGFFVSGIVSPSYVYITEFTTVEYKAKFLLIASAVASLAATYEPGMAWIILPLSPLKPWGLFTFESWRLFIIVTAMLPLICAILLVFAPESPKFLLSSGNEVETLNKLRIMFAFNSGLKGEDFQVKSVCLDKGDEYKSQEGTGIMVFFKTLVVQTGQILRPPFLKYTLLGGVMQFAIIGVYNVIMLWVPEVVNKVTLYNELHPRESATVCQVIMSKSSLQVFNITGHEVSIPSYAYNESVPIQSELCSNKMSMDVFITNMMIGFSQFLMFLVASTITAWVGRKNFIVLNLLLAAICTLLLTCLTIPYMIYISMGAITILLGASLPLTMSILVDLFPTYIRSMSSAMCLICGRIGVAAGSQFFGFMQQINCDAGYYTIGALLASVSCLSLLLPLKRNLD